MASRNISDDEDEMLQLAMALSLGEDMASRNISDDEDKMLQLAMALSLGQDIDEKYVHGTVTCDGCKVFPIRGTRYKCDVCDDYDLCEACHRRDVHTQHPLTGMIKPRTNEQSPPALAKSSHKDKETYTSLTHEIQESMETLEAGGPLDRFPDRRCNKQIKSNNRHHNMFIPFIKFHPTDLTLPSEFSAKMRRQMFEWIKSMGQLVVRLEGKFVSKHRPDDWKTGPYPMKDNRGKKCNFGGSGWVFGVNVNKCSDKFGCGQTHSMTDDKMCYCISILTARHVIYDESEAEVCNVVFFDERPDGKETVTLTGGKIGAAGTNEDFCCMRVYTHDKDFGSKVDQLRYECWDKRVSFVVSMLENVKESNDRLLSQCNDKWNTLLDNGQTDDKLLKECKDECDKLSDVNKRFDELCSGCDMKVLVKGVVFGQRYKQMCYFDHTLETQSRNKLYHDYNNKAELMTNILTEKYNKEVMSKLPVIVIGHPHCKMKYVSVGEYKGREEFDHKDYTKWHYTSATCPGNSGCLIFDPIGWFTDESFRTKRGCNIVMSGLNCHVHSGADTLEGRSVGATVIGMCSFFF